MFDQAGDDLAQDCGYPDEPANKFLEKVASGEEPPPTRQRPPRHPRAAAEAGERARAQGQAEADGADMED